ncbi:an1-type zinc finger protein 1 [Moniliophthora roreri MCA 2997]|uniref:An1-type zinc finger protein 1 n=1 Tax=Moniliophthora roreri (strain MCA 2997) TaxID=1381753 RepID=V2X7G6_MONRO|nr:an1-type zinc finger protein 1 [Moniliophthora roreri MCA 2997]
MSELLEVGNHCAVCPQIDFLPIRCHCNKFFCKDHIAPDAHTCSALGGSERSNFDNKLHRCHFENCQKLSLNLSGSDASSASCPQCTNCFCVEHRHPVAHNCSVNVTEKPRNEAARALLSKHFSAKASAKAAATATNAKPKSAAQQKLEMMKMRQRAVPLDPKDRFSSLSVAQRRFVKAKIESGAEEKIIWTQKDVTTGRVFDMLASHLCLPSSQWSRYRLCKVLEDEPLPLQNDKIFADEVDDGTLVVFVAS